MRFIKFLSLFVLLACFRVEPPKAVMPIPDKKQIEWQTMEFYGFIHFGLNTFTNTEWGYGNSNPNLFNPDSLDTEQWVLTAKKAGMKGLIITAKHHDGFCLWPSNYTAYSVKNSVWKNGNGDVIKELSDACKKHGLKLGIYLSPWDRHNADYGRPEYITYFRNQLTELLTNYGPLFEIWFDGANGGDGYYGGSDEIRYVDKKNYYDWKNTYSIIRKLQPDAIIWSDAGPDARWVGNEHGFAYETTWSPLIRDSIYGGMPEYARKYAMGQEKGTHWVPAEADVSIRPGWFYHQNEDNKVKTLKELLDIYYESVGQNATLLLNLPLDKHGLIPKTDSIQLIKLSRQLHNDFKNDLARNKQITASNVRGNSKKYAANRVLDGDCNTYWATDDSETRASLTIDFGKTIQFNRIVLQEYITLGQRVKSFSIAIEKNGKWQLLDTHSTIGYKRILRYPKITTERIKLTIIDARACPLISTVQVFNAPVIVDEPIIERNKEGLVNFISPDKGTSIYYTIDNSTPKLKGKKFEKPFMVSSPTIIKAFSYDSITQNKSEIASKQFDISKNKWTIMNLNNKNTINAIDDDFNTECSLKDKEVILELGESISLIGFTYTPSQQRWPKGIITHYTLFSSVDNKSWHQIKSGEFSNIISNPVQQKVYFDYNLKTRYLKFTIEKIAGNSENAVIAEIGVITKT